MKHKSNPENVLKQVQELERKVEILSREMCWMKENDQEKELALQVIRHRISNDFPVEKWDDDREDE
jgi:hypothetical protein